MTTRRYTVRVLHLPFGGGGKEYTLCVRVCDFVQNRSFTSGLNPCKCTTAKK